MPTSGFSVYTSYNPSLPFTMKFPGASFCDGKQKLMMIATLPLSIRKVFLNRVHKKLDSMSCIWKKVKRLVFLCEDSLKLYPVDLNLMFLPVLTFLKLNILYVA